MRAALVAAREPADTRKPVEGSMLLAVALLPAMKVKAPSGRAKDPWGDPTGAAALDSGAPAGIVSMSQC